MSQARQQRRKNDKDKASHMMMLANLLGDFYEFLSKTPQPTTEEVRATFIESNEKWQRYCKFHKLMNVEHMFSLNVREAWNKHNSKPSEKQ